MIFKDKTDNHGFLLKDPDPEGTKHVDPVHPDPDGQHSCLVRKLLLSLYFKVLHVKKSCFKFIEGTIG